MSAETHIGDTIEVAPEGRIDALIHWLPNVANYSVTDAWQLKPVTISAHTVIEIKKINTWHGKSSYRVCIDDSFIKSILLLRQLPSPLRIISAQLASKEANHKILSRRDFFEYILHRSSIVYFNVGLFVIAALTTLTLKRLIKLSSASPSLITTSCDGSCAAQAYQTIFAWQSIALSVLTTVLLVSHLLRKLPKTYVIFQSAVKLEVLILSVILTVEIKTDIYPNILINWDRFCEHSVIIHTTIFTELFLH